MLYPQEVIEEVRMGNDIVDVVSSYVQLKNRGGNYFGLCPFHKEKSPSFSVNQDKQMFYCFGCGAGGNVVSFVMQMENYGFLEALKYLADRINYRLPEARMSEEMVRLAQTKELLLELHKKAARFFYDALSAEEGRKAAAYLDSRGISPKFRVRFGLGYCPARRGALVKFLTDAGYSRENIVKSGLAIADKSGGCFDRFSGRLMFPILDAQGGVVGFGGRILEAGEPKYLNSPETPIFEKSRVLYGLNLARKSKAKSVVLVEGYMDVISLHQAGFANACAALGTSFNAEHSRLLKKYCDGVTLLFDSDEAGTKAALRAIPVLLSGKLKIRVQQVTGAKDPDEYIKQYGAEGFQELLSGARNHITFQIDCLRRGYDLEDTDQRVSFTNEAAKILAALDNDIERDAYVKEVAAATGISDQAVYREVGKLMNRPAMTGPASRRAVPRTYPYGPQNRGTNQDERGVVEAQKSLLRILASERAACRAVMALLKPEEMTSAVFGRLLELAYGFAEQEREAQAAELLNYFEEPEEQRLAAEVFSGGVRYGDKKELEKAVNDNLRAIKRHNAEKAFAESGDQLQKIAELAENKRNIEKLYITISDG